MAMAMEVDMIPLEGVSTRKMIKPNKKPSSSSTTTTPADKSTVLYIGRIPHGFYEDEMRGFFEQFGAVKNLKVSRNRKTGKSKHYGFVEFEYPEVAKIVADSMHNYLMFENILQVHPIPPERVHRKLWKGVNSRQRTPVDFVKIAMIKHNKDRTLEEQQKLVKTILKRDRKRKSKIAAAGIDYECPKIEGADQPVSKKIRFEDN